jgi:ABC-2 type transport system ATP-binding protein
MTETSLVASATEARLGVRGLTYSYGSREVLRGLDFEVRRGEVFGLLGPNGSGKSTGLGVLAGLLPRQGGEVSWDGRPVSSFTRAWRAATAVVFQSPAIDEKLTARQNLSLAARIQGLSGADAARRVERGLEQASLSDRADDLVSKFSGGMTRRLDLARALLPDPELLLMDEPTAGLDEAAFREAWERLDAMREGRELTILVATHRPDEAARCHRLAVVSEGRVAAVRTPEELRAEVGNDVLALTSDDTPALRDELAATFQLDGRIEGGELLVECEAGHALIPRLVEGLPPGRLETVSLRRPSLADAFFRISGHRLDEELVDGDPAALQGSGQ